MDEYTEFALTHQDNPFIKGITEILDKGSDQWTDEFIEAIEMEDAEALVLYLQRTFPMRERVLIVLGVAVGLNAVRHGLTLKDMTCED